MNAPPWHPPIAEANTEHLHTSPEGLTSGESGKRLEQYGPNRLPEQKVTHPVVILLRQFARPLIVILIVAAVVTSPTFSRNKRAPLSSLPFRRSIPWSASSRSTRPRKASWPALRMMGVPRAGRSETESVFRIPLFSNPFLCCGLLASFIVRLAATCLPSLPWLLQMESLSGGDG